MGYGFDINVHKFSVLRLYSMSCDMHLSQLICGKTFACLHSYRIKKGIEVKQGISEGFDRCNWPSNLKLDSNRRFFRPCDREI